MSSILDALKKLEQKKEEQHQDVKWPQPVDTKRAIAESLEKKSSRKPLFIGMMICLAIAAGVWGLTKTPVKEPKAPEVTSRPALKAPAKRPEKKEQPVAVEPDNDVKPDLSGRLDFRKRSELRRQLEDPTSHRKNLKSDDASDLSRKATTDKRLSRDGRKERPAPGPDLFKRLNKDGDSNRSPFNPEEPPADIAGKLHKEAVKPNPPAPAPVVQPDKDTPAPSEMDEEVAELLDRIPKDMLPPKKMVEDGSLKLQAISWSDDPARRIAVINSQLVKEGREIEGARVGRIDRDYVVIIKNGEELMLPFGGH